MAQGILINPKEIGNLLCDHFSTLFNSNSGILNIGDLPLGNTVSNEIKHSLKALVLDQEILEALNDIVEDKMHGFDGFTTKFFLPSIGILWANNC